MTFCGVMYLGEDVQLISLALKCKDPEHTMVLLGLD